MRIFITGVAGFLGSHIADAMLALGHDVIGVDDLSGGELENVPMGVTFREVNCDYFEDMKWYSAGADIVFHCAAHAHEGLSVFSPSHIVHNIVSASTAVFSAAIANRVKRIVFCSSMARYGDATIPYQEEDRCSPVDPYGFAKWASEHILKALCREHGVEYAIAVPHNIVGPRQKYDDPFRNVASIMANLMMQDRAVVVYGDGKQQRCFSDVRDCVECLVKMAFEPQAKNQTINIGPDGPVVTINDLVQRLDTLLNIAPRIKYLPKRPAEVKFALCSSDKAREALGFAPKYSLDDSLQSIIDHIRERGPKPFNYHIPLEIVTERTPRTWKERLF